MLKSEILLWSMLGLAPPFGNGLTPPWGGVPPWLRTSVLESLNSSLAQSAAELWLSKFGQKWLMFPLVKLLEFCQKLGF